MRKIRIFAFTLILWTGNSAAYSILTSFPEFIDPQQKYVFYSHGYIVEGINDKPEHPRWGVYDFPAIKTALSDNGYTLIAYHRPKNTEPFLFAKSLAGDAQKLLERGVKPENITFVGFSRGGALSILTSNELKNDKVNFIILAGCAGLIKKHINVKAFGNIYSIYETSDTVGSCQFLIDRSPGVSRFEEFSISTGKEHGAFYRPTEEWISPVKRWLLEK